MNRHLILIAGKSASGKSASLQTLRDPEKVLYLCCESGKELPFRSKFKEMVVTDPMVIPKVFAKAEGTKDIETIVIDTLTYLMDMYESKYVLTASNTMKAWSDYAQYFKRLHQDVIANSTKNVLVLAHTADVYNEDAEVHETMVKIKGSVMNTGVESYYTQVVAAKKMAVRDLAEYKNPMLHIEPEAEATGIKYCFQTKLTKETVNERIRNPIGLWKTEETYIDNDAQALIDKITTYYS